MRVQTEESSWSLSRIDSSAAPERVALPRRGFLRSFIGVIAAPAIVRATSLMPVKVCDNRVEWTDLDELALPPRNPAWKITPSFPILRSEDPQNGASSSGALPKPRRLFHRIIGQWRAGYISCAEGSSRKV